MFGQRKEILEIKKALVGLDYKGNEFNPPAFYSALGRIKELENKLSENIEIIDMLLDELGFTLESGTRIVKKTKLKK